MKEVIGINDSKDRRSVDQKIHFMTDAELIKSLAAILHLEHYNIQSLRKWVAEISTMSYGWQMDISEEQPILCWVSDVSSEGVSVFKGAALINHFDPESKYPYQSENGSGLWTSATPVLESEIYKERVA